MNDQPFVNQELLEDLRALAADSRRETPQYIEENLVTAFRARRRRRTLLGWAPLGLAAMIALGLWFGHSTKQVTATKPASTAAPASVAIEEEADAGFYPLPQAEALPVVENAMVVRVQLPVSSLQLMGVPVSEDGPETSVQAELLLGQDGLARGVRLVE